MMTIAGELYDLQQIDSAIDAAKAGLAAVEEQLGESEELIASRQAVEERREALKGLRDQQRDQEWQVEDLRSRLATVEQKLYGGSVPNPRELAGLKEEADVFSGQIRRLEDELLNLMVGADEAAAAQKEAKSSLAAVEARWGKDQQDLLGQKERLEAELAELGQGRDRESGRLDPRVLSTYERLRESRQGRAVAKVERGMCQGCRITLPVGVLQKARTGFEVVQCVSCERILYVS
jgi:predicted  nucleic acid-binding Zn-ribbon protein